MSEQAPSKLEYLKSKYMSRDTGKASSSSTRRKKSKKSSIGAEGFKITVEKEVIPDPKGAISALEIADEGNNIRRCEEDDDDVCVTIESSSNGLFDMGASEHRWVRMGETPSVEPQSVREGCGLSIKSSKRMKLTRLQSHLMSAKRGDVEYVYDANTVAESIRTATLTAVAETPLFRQGDATPAPWNSPAVAKRDWENDGADSDDSDICVRRDPSASTVRRGRRDRRGKEQEEEEEEEDPVEKAQVLERYELWSRGIAQIRESQKRATDNDDAANKPLARGVDDTELDAYMKEQLRKGDPMLKFLEKSSCKVGEAADAPRKPCIHPALPNRYDLKPGSRWDGVDRSNGFEKKLFAEKASKLAVAEIAYKWRVEDM